MIKKILRGLPAAFLLLAAVAVQAAQSGVSVQAVAEIEQTYTAADGSTQTRMVPLETVVPGDEVVFTLRFENGGDQPAENVVLQNPLPPQMRYVEGTAEGADAVIEFSIDGGSSWGTPETLRVATANGARPATAADYTNVRWRLRQPIAPGQSGFVRYRAIVK